MFNGIVHILLLYYNVYRIMRTKGGDVKHVKCNENYLMWGKGKGLTVCEQTKWIT